MAEIITLAEIDINYDKVLKDTSDLRKQVQELDIEYKNSVKTNGKNSEETIKYAAELSNLKKELKEQERLVSDVVKIQNTEIGTIKTLTAQNAILRKEQKDLNLTTEEGVKRNAEINKQINANTEAIKENSDTQAKGFQQIGQYEKANQALAGVLPNVSNGIKGVGEQFKLLIKSPIVLVLAAIVGAFALLKKAFERNAENSNKLGQALGKLSGLFNGLLKVLEPVATFIVDKLIGAFETLGKISNKVLNLVASGLGALGFDNAAKSINNFTTSLSDAAKAGSELAKAEQELIKANREANKLQLDYQKKAEKLRQLRDDESYSIKERVKFNTQLNAVLTEQLAKELEIANKGLSHADLKIKVEGETNENLDYRAEALTKISDIEERLSGQESEYLANVNSLRKEQIALEKEISDKKQKASEDEIKRKADEIKELEKLANEQIALLDKEYQAWLDNNVNKLQAQKEFNEAILAEQQSVAQTKLDSGLITEMEYNEAISAARRNFDASELERQKEVNQYSFEALMQSKTNSVFAELDLQQQKLNKEYENSLAYADAIGADKTQIEKNYADKSAEIDSMRYSAAISIASETAADLVTILGETTTAGKIAATAGATIDTLESAVSSYNAMSSIPYVGPVLGGIAAAAAMASGIATVNDIWAVDTSVSGNAKKSSTNSAKGYSSIGSGLASANTSAISQINTSIGQGIVARDTGISTQNYQPTTEKIIVVDEVTAAQNLQMQKTNISSI